MCGITGILNTQHYTAVLPPFIRPMTDAIAHRGPDAEGFYEDEDVALGHRRLSIIDLSTGANQPFEDSSGRYVLVFNGEIYNYLDIKPLLTDYIFKTTSDTEVLLAAYIKWGKDCLQYLNGMFAFAIWDKDKKELFIARDRLGVKPLYYYQDQNYFLFASELRALLASGIIPKSINTSALREYLMFQSVYAPQTIIKGVYQLMPGTYMTLTTKAQKAETYWDITEARSHLSSPRTYQEAQETVKTLLDASVERRMMSDVPLGAFLSGGIDSSAVVALMAQHSEQPISTFSVVFDEVKFDESQYAKIVAKKYKTRHEVIRLKPNQLLKELPDVLSAIDVPSGDGINTYVVSKATRDAGVTVALSGLGGDELFGGYPYFKHYARLRTQASAYWHIPVGLRRALLNVVSSTQPTNKKLLRIASILGLKEPTIAAIYPFFRMVCNEAEIESLLSVQNETDVSTITQLLNNKQQQIAELPYMGQVSVAELLGYTLNVLLRDTDQFSMASALEVREPFFDYTLVEYVLGLPDNYKYDKKIPKSLLVNALGDLLPSEVVYRTKMGFSFPWQEWLLNDLKPFCEKYLYRLGQYDFFDLNGIKAKWEMFTASKGTAVSWVKIWQLVVLSYWLETNEI